MKIRGSLEELSGINHRPGMAKWRAQEDSRASFEALPGWSKVDRLEEAL